MYKNLAELKEAFETGKLDPEKDIVRVDNDNTTLYIRKEDDEFGVDAECVFHYEDLPRYLLVEALKMLGIPAAQV